LAFGPFTVHGSRAWRIGGDLVRVDAVAREGFVDASGDPHEGTVAMIVIDRAGGTKERSWLHVGERIVLGREQWVLTRVGDRGRIAEWMSHEPVVPTKQPGRFAVFAPAE
jgi:hypothetical protein